MEVPNQRRRIDDLLGPACYRTVRGSSATSANSRAKERSGNPLACVARRIWSGAHREPSTFGHLVVDKQCARSRNQLEEVETVELRCSRAVLPAQIGGTLSDSTIISNAGRL